VTSDNPTSSPSPTAASVGSGGGDGLASKETVPPSRPVSRIGLGLTPLQRDNPWPDFCYGEVEPFTLALDGNGDAGRELVVDIIREKRISLMVEIGCFLCGSTLQWLRASDDLTIIGVDPWDGNWAFYIEDIAAHPVMKRSVSHLSDADRRHRRQPLAPRKFLHRPEQRPCLQAPVPPGSQKIAGSA